MPNETRPRRESSSTSRLRGKAAQPTSSNSSDDDAPPEPYESNSGPSPVASVEPTSQGTMPIPSTPPYRDREDRPADREPPRYRERTNGEREGGLSIRERLAARDRADRESNPAGPRGEAREGGPLSRPREAEFARDRPEREPAPARDRAPDRDPGTRPSPDASGWPGRHPGSLRPAGPRRAPPRGRRGRVRRQRDPRPLRGHQAR